MAMLAPTRVFYGFSTLDTNSKQQSFADVALIDRDLLNHFNTLPGERVMMPLYGCKIWNLLFEQFDDATIQAVISEAERVVATETRVILQSVEVKQINQGLLVQMQLFYQPYGVVNTFNVEFDRRAVALDSVA
jgi:phage baseplate assembly protein W